MTEDLRNPVRAPPANYVYGCPMTSVTCRALGYVFYQKGIIQGHLVNRYASRRAPALCSRIVFRTVLSLDVNTQTVFLYYMSVKLLWGVISDVFWCPCYSLVVMSNRWTQYNFPTLHRLSIWGHRWILALLLIFVDWYKHSNTNVVGCKCILNRFFIKMSTLHNGLHKQFELYVFLLSLVLNLAYIDYTLCQIWSAYMQYLRRYDHSNKYSFLVI